MSVKVLNYHTIIINKNTNQHLAEYLNLNMKMYMKKIK